MEVHVARLEYGDRLTFPRARGASGSLDVGPLRLELPDHAARTSAGMGGT